MANSREIIEEKLRSLFEFDEESASYPKLKKNRDLAGEYARTGEMGKVNALLIAISEVPDTQINGIPDGQNNKSLADEYNVHILAASLFGQSLNGAFKSCDGVRSAMESVPVEYRKMVAETVIDNSPHNHLWPKYTPVDFRFDREVLKLLKQYCPPVVSVASNGLFGAARDNSAAQGEVVDHRYSRR